MEFDVNGKKLYVTPPPGSGVLIGFIMNILKGYKFNKASMDDPDEKILTHHRIIEAYKFAYGKRTEIGDTAFINIDEVVKIVCLKLIET
jgi:gamma-glutamyltranspeptidase / glutathione hydrolase / leukotriene-C4 hydrolase